MHRFLFTNTYFEEELLSPLTNPIEFIQKYPVHLPLNYLSCLTCEENETPLLCLPPEEDYFKRLEMLGVPFNYPSYLTNPLQGANILDSFGASKSLASWAERQGCLYDTPPLDLVKKINSKDFSFNLGPKLKEAELIYTEEELSIWWKKVKGIKVLKTLHGFSGRGHFISQWDGEDLESALIFFRSSQKISTGIVAEPWVNRILDFSSQWEIRKNGTFFYLGSTVCLNSPRGVYRKSFAGPEALIFQEYLDFFKEHLFYAEEAIKKIALLGFFGNLGFDAMLYRSDENNEIKIHPIVEINARKTMGWVALKIHKKLKWEEPLAFSLEMKKTASLSWLPLSASTPKGLQIPFKAQLIIEKKQDPILHIC